LVVNENLRIVLKKLTFFVFDVVVRMKVRGRPKERLWTA